MAPIFPYRPFTLVKCQDRFVGFSTLFFLLDRFRNSIGGSFSLFGWLESFRVLPNPRQVRVSHLLGPDSDFRKAR